MYFLTDVFSEGTRFLPFVVAFGQQWLGQGRICPLSLVIPFVSSGIICLAIIICQLIALLFLENDLGPSDQVTFRPFWTGGFDMSV